MTFQLGSALLDACVLATLNREDTYGYVLTQSVKAVVEISESTLYPVLRRLQKEGWLTTYDQPYSGRLRRYYAITDAARRLRATVPNGTFTKNKLKACCLEGKMLNNRVQFNRRQESRSPELRRDEAKFFSENTACIAQDLYYAYARALGRWL